MCPEGSKIKINKKIITAIIITAIVLLTVFVIVRYAVLRPVPELQRLKGLEVNRYDVACYAYDGDKYSHVIKKFKSADEYKRELLKITGLMDTRLVKVNDWTPDKITYPVYSLEITPVIFKSEKYEHGETFVWSNGYLITSSGDVYRSGLFFKRYLNNDEDDYFRETDTITNIADIRPFRPQIQDSNMGSVQKQAGQCFSVFHVQNDQLNDPAVRKIFLDVILLEFVICIFRVG